MSALLHQKSDDSDLLSETSSTSDQSDQTPEPEELIYSLWDWPLNEDGLARAVEDTEKFCVNLDFSYIQKGTKDLEVKHYCNSYEVARGGELRSLRPALHPLEAHAGSLSAWSFGRGTWEPTSVRRFQTVRRSPFRRRP